MKFPLAVFLASFATMAAAIDTPIVQKTNFHGFGPPEARQLETCNVYADRVEIILQAGETKISEIRAISGAGDLLALASDTSGDRILSTPNDMCDGPRTGITAFSPNAPGGITLFDTGACGQASVKRDGVSSRLLIWIVNKYCPETFLPRSHI